LTDEEMRRIGRDILLDTSPGEARIIRVEPPIDMAAWVNECNLRLGFNSYRIEVGSRAITITRKGARP
jgi:hypothetical protein